MRNRHLRALSMPAVLLGAALIFGCGSDETDTGRPECEFGERYNPVSGECVPSQALNNTNSTNGANNVNSANSTNNQNSANSTNNVNNVDVDAGMDAGEVDMGDPNAERCDEALDSDNDGLTNACECELGTNPYAEDTDGDGLTDAEEDADGSCRFTPGETDARQADTDYDGATDKEEIEAGTNPLLQDTDEDGVMDGAELASGCMNPLESDTDMDSLPDGIEDRNMDGELGSCPDRMFAPDCAGAESDPCAEDTDGDGTLDPGEAQYRDCRPEDLNNLVTPQLLTNSTADYQLVLEQAAATSAVMVPNSTVEAHVFEDTAQGYTGFIVSLTPSGGQTNPSLIGDSLVSSVQGLYSGAVRRVGGRRITTHDNLRAAAGAIIDLPASTSLDTARDAILADLLGANPSQINHTLTSTMAGDTSPTLFVHQIISRDANQYLLVGALVTLDTYSDNTKRAGFLVDDLTNGPSVATAMEQSVDECVAYTVTEKAKVDIIISIDGSGSMNNEQTRLQSFATTFTTLLTQSNLDWRAGVTRPDCGDISDLSADMQGIVQAHCDGMVNIPGGFPFPLPGNGAAGELVGGDFTTDPSELQSRLDPGTFSGGGEYTISAVTAAADRALPRSDADASKFRSDAAVILIAITDEEDEWFQSALTWGNSQLTMLDPTQQAELEMKTTPFIEYLLKPELGATAFGVAWVPGDAGCADSAAVAHSISQIVNETGGAMGSICQSDFTNTLREIAEATAGIASGLRLRGTPLPPTLKVVQGQAVTGNIVDMTRSRADGWDYDPIVNRIAFRGMNPPQTGDRVVIPYRRWENSVFMCMTNDDCPSEQKVKCVEGECR